MKIFFSKTAKRIYSILMTFVLIFGTTPIDSHFCITDVHDHDHDVHVEETDSSLSDFLSFFRFDGLVVTVAAWENEADCEFCGSFIADDYICDCGNGGDHCSEESGRSCYEEHHCPQCNKAYEDDHCGNCGSCSDCAIICSGCGDACSDCSYICEDCNQCSDCVNLCADCKALCEDCAPEDAGWPIPTSHIFMSTLRNSIKPHIPSKISIQASFPLIVDFLGFSKLQSNFGIVYCEKSK